MNHNKTSVMTLIALFTAVTCILGPLAIPLPFSPVPITFTNLAIYFTVYLCGMKKGTISYLLYLMVGFIGVPVFSGFSAGPAKLLGPTGGYLIGFIFLALITGYFADRFQGKRPAYLAGMTIGTLILYLFGTAWLAYQAGLTFEAALFAGVIPYIPGDLIKMGIAASLAPVIRRRLEKTGYLSDSRATFDEPRR
jgi:biotin transport system substrate-specific component